MENNGINILICGSQKFDDRSFVWQTLETFYDQTKGNISTISTSKFSGACQFALEWAEHKKQNKIHISIHDVSFDFQLEKKNQSLYEQLDIPPFILQTDPFFQKGKELILQRGIKLVLAFPNPEGILGAATRNIQRFAQLAGIHSFDCSDLLSKIHAYRNNQMADKKEQQTVQLENKHPNKKLF